MIESENTKDIPNPEISSTCSENIQTIPEDTTRKNTNNDFSSTLHSICGESDNIVKLINAVVGPIENYKKHEFELRREEIVLEKELAKIKVGGEKSRIRWICIVIGILISASIALFLYGVLSAETVAFLFGTLAGCLVTFAARSEKIVVVRDEPIQEE